MANQGYTDVRANIVSSMPASSENVFKMTQPEVIVGPGETFDITIDCQMGFSVYLPYPGFFAKQEWEAQPVPPEDISGAPKHQWWRVRLTRNKGDNYSSIRKMAYCVYSKDLDNFAVGNSPPKMTLEP
jgi:hypothetical protein